MACLESPTFKTVNLLKGTREAVRVATARAQEQQVLVLIRSQTSAAAARQLLNEASRSGRFSPQDLRHLEEEVRRIEAQEVTEAQRALAMVGAGVDRGAVIAAAMQGGAASPAVVNSVLDTIESVTKAPLGIDRKTPGSLRQTALVDSSRGWYKATPIADGKGTLPTGGASILYELEATARLVDKPSPGHRAATELAISATRDDLSFGQRFASQISGRASIEADVLIHRHGFGPIGVDMKHSSNGGAYGSIDQGELDALVALVADGTLREFHFVTNGTFTPGAKERIESAAQAAAEARDALVNDIRTRPESALSVSELSLRLHSPRSGPLISWHENV